MKRVIVTGANGFVGSSLINKLVSKNIEVVALDISFKNSKLPQSDLITEIEIKLENAKEIEKVIPVKEYDIFYHFAWAGVNGFLKGEPSIQIKNIEMAITCALIAKNFGCKRFLCAGTIAERAIESLPYLENTNSGMMYGAAKHALHLILETYCKNIGLSFIWMQFSNIYGPGNTTGNLVSYAIGELLENKEAIFGPAIQPYDFIYIEDLIEAVIRLGESKTRHSCYFIGSGKPRLLKEYLFEIGRACGKEELIKIGLRPDDGIKYTLDMFDITKLEEDIGSYVSVPFNDGIEYTLKNY